MGKLVGGQGGGGLYTLPKASQIDHIKAHVKQQRKGGPPPCSSPCLVPTTVHTKRGWGDGYRVSYYTFKSSLGFNNCPPPFVLRLALPNNQPLVKLQPMGSTPDRTAIFFVLHLARLGGRAALFFFFLRTPWLDRNFGGH